MGKKISEKDLNLLISPEGLTHLLDQKQIYYKDTIAYLKYKNELKLLQAELINLQIDVAKNKRRVAIIFEGRDAAGKGDSIKRFREHSNPRSLRTVSFPKLSDSDKKHWYFQRYKDALPTPGEIVLFDRSWNSRGVVEPVNSFCTQDEYNAYLQDVVPFEESLLSNNIEVIKLWFSVTKDTQKKRLEQRAKNPLEKWMLSSLDLKAQENWDKYTSYKMEMFKKTHTVICPWIIIKSPSRRTSRLESLRYVLSRLEYDTKGSSGVDLQVNTELTGPATDFVDL